MKKVFDRLLHFVFFSFRLYHLRLFIHVAASSIVTDDIRSGIEYLKPTYNVFVPL